MSDDIIQVPDQSDFDGIEELEIISGIGVTGYTQLLQQALNLENLENKMVQYFRVGKKYERPEDGPPKVVNRGRRKGVFLAYPDPVDSYRVNIGYSLCHRRDRFDFKDGTRMKGLGIWHAFTKAEKYASSDRYVVATHARDKQLPKSVVKIPQSMANDMARFIVRCRKFFKGKEIPPWSFSFALDQYRKMGERIDVSNDSIKEVTDTG